MMTNAPILSAFAILLTLLSQVGETYASCTRAYSSTCDSVDFTATSSVFFQVNSTATNKNYETYNVTVIFHWDLENITVGPTPYKIGDPIGLSSEYQYDDEGYYQVGYTIIFEDGAASGCSGKTYNSSTILKMQSLPAVCEWDAEMPKPTMSPTLSASPTVSLIPSMSPTIPLPDSSGRSNHHGLNGFGGKMLLLLVAALFLGVIMY